MEQISMIAISALIKDFTKPVGEGAVALGREALKKWQVIFEGCFSKYIERSYQRYSKTKTLLYRERPVDLKEFYVRTDLGLGDEVVCESTFISRIKSERRVIVSGIAGSGKSTFCKSIFIELIEKPDGIVPIFLELRHLNSSGRGSLMSFVVSTLASIEPDFTQEHLEYALRMGKILLIFDGFDEIDGEVREQYEREIIEISSRYHKVMVIVSSRPDNRFNSWEEFYKYDVRPLDQDKAVLLIEKLEYDHQVKEKFLGALKATLFEKHISFASSPLLLTMMLLTYEQIAEIPNKIHLFYEQAFLTLFNKHDSLKSLYKRKSFSDLPLDDFRRVLSAFCMLSYLERRYYFSENEIFRFLKRSIQVSDVKCTADSFLRDLLDSVCIMQRDGLGYTFTHRSFQEYFSALFVINLSGHDKYQVIDRVAFVNDRDIIIPMIYDMNRDLIEQEWIIPRLNILITELESVSEGPDREILMLGKLYGSIITHRGDGIAYTHYHDKPEHTSFLYLLGRIYNHEIAKYFKAKKNKQTDAEKKVERELIRLDLKDNAMGVILDDVESLSKATRQRLVKSGSCRLANIILEYSKEKRRRLESRHSKKKANLESLLFG